MVGGPFLAEDSELGALVEDCQHGELVDSLTTPIVNSMEEAINRILQHAGLRTIVDSLHGSLICRGHNGPVRRRAPRPLTAGPERS